MYPSNSGEDARSNRICQEVHIFAEFTQGLAPVPKCYELFNYLDIYIFFFLYLLREPESDKLEVPQVPQSNVLRPATGPA